MIIKDIIGQRVKINIAEGVKKQFERLLPVSIGVVIGFYIGGSMMEPRFIIFVSEGKKVAIKGLFGIKFIDFNPVITAQTEVMGLGAPIGLDMEE
ncbi:hypothetical protein LCGC14_1421180 [marine sediment metagenome]|uniref:Uncharacterized protein n=1 Tax=marine sediment metagenome TaxID=412755 RepID=A0A0F9M6W8_9ZZZZ